MDSPPGNPDSDSRFDAIVIGGAFSGSAAAILLKEKLPDLKIAIVERSVEFDRKVGESTSEVAGCFLTRRLHLSEYLNTQHFVKHGLRMWFHKSQDDTVCDSTELGPKFQVRLPTYQLDRAKLDAHLIEKAIDLGCTLIRPAQVREIHTADGDGEPTGVSIRLPDGTRQRLFCEKLIDATGKAAVLPRKLGLFEKLGDEHPTSALWSRFTNVRPLDSAEARDAHPSLTQGTFSARGSATNHLMGYGWWCWIIPLSNGDYSAGLVWDRRIFDLPPGEHLRERLHAHLRSHPVGKLMFGDAVAVEKDTHYHKGLGYRSTKFVGTDWIVVGDASGFMDPMYSQGLDFCAHTISGGVDYLAKHFSGKADCATMAAAYLNEAFPLSMRRWFTSLYKDKYYYIGDAELMRIAYLLDLATYFAGPVRLVYTDPELEFTRMPFHGPVGGHVAKFMSFYNRRLKVLAQHRISKGTYGARNTGERLLIISGFTPTRKPSIHLIRGLAFWLRAEIRDGFPSEKPASEPADAPTMARPLPTSA